VDPAHGDAEQRRPVGPVRRGPGRHADVGPAQEQRQRHHGQRGHHPGGHVVGVERERRDVPVAAEGQVDPDGVGHVVPQLGEFQGGEGQELGEPDGGHGQREARGAEEAADDGQLDHRAQHHRGGQPDGQAREVADARQQDQVGGEGDRHEPELALGEVDHPVRPVGQGHAQCHQRREQAQRDPTQDEAPLVAAVGPGAREGELLHDDHHHGRSDAPGRRLDSGHGGLSGRRRRGRRTCESIPLGCACPEAPRPL
jgi:hypothetical protein